MNKQHAQAAPSFRELFTPKLITVFQEGYGLDKLRADLIAGMSPKDRKMLAAAGVKPPDAEFADSIAEALEILRKTPKSR
jgi:SulP family sulfate permease